MKTKSILIRLFALMLAIAMLFTVAACTDGKTSSDADKGADDAINYGDDLADEFGEDDADSVTIQTGNSGGSGGSGGKDAAVDYGDMGIENKFQISESKKQALIDSVPAKYKDGKTTVSVLTWWQAMDVETKKMDVFAKKTGIKTKFIQSDWSDDGSAYVQKLASLRVQGSAPDLAGTTTSNNYPSMYIQGLFRPVSESKLDLSKTDVFDLETMNMLKWNGKHYGVAIKGADHMNLGLLLYNADIFENAGIKTPYEFWKEGAWTWDNFVKIGKEILTKTQVDPVCAGYQGHRLMQTCGEDAVIFKNGKMVNNTSSTVFRNGYKWLNSLTAAGEHKILKYGGHEDFMDASCAMYVTESWIMKADERLNDVAFKIGFATLPTPDGKVVVPCDAQLWGFVDGAKNIEAASYVLEYWHNPAYDEKGYPLWMNDSVAQFISYLWEQPKTFQLSHTVVGYGGDYKYYSENYKLATCGVANVDSTVDAYSSIIESNLNKIYAEFKG